MRAIPVDVVSMIGESIEERNGGYYATGSRVSLDSVVYSFERGNSPDAIQKEFPALRLPQIYGISIDQQARFASTWRKRWLSGNIPDHKASRGPQPQSG